MSRILVTVSLAIVVLSGAIAAQQSQPDFSGRWELVADKTTPAGSEAVLGPWFVIKQAETSLTIERTETKMSSQGGRAGNPATVQQIEVPSTETYVFDGTERDRQRTAALPVPAGARVVDLNLPTYRATWTTNQLVIIVTNKDALRGTTSLARLSLSLEADGSLVADRVEIIFPRSGGAKQGPPTPRRSVYLKKS